MKASRAALPMLLLTAAACGGGATAPTAASAPVQASHAAVHLAVDPDPVASVADGGTVAAQRVAVWTLRITETAGVGATVNFLNETLRGAPSGAVADPGGRTSLGAADIAALAGSTHLAAKGTLAIPCRLVYALPEESVGGQVTLTLQLTDDTGEIVSASVSVPVV